MRKKVSVGWSDRIFSTVSYLTAGWGGMIIMVILYFQKRTPSKFLRYNVFQSIFISLLFFVLAMGLGLVMQILSFIPFVNYLVAQISYLLNKPFIGDYSILQTFMTMLILYLSVFSFFGRYPRVLWISKIIDYASR